MKIYTTGQFGNWLFHTAAAIKKYGNVDNIVNRGIHYNEYIKSNILWKAITDIPATYFSQYKGKDVKNDAKISNWQSLSEIPSREECRKIFKIKKLEPCKDPVIHIRGGDYFTFFNIANDKISISKKSIYKIAEKFNCLPEDCVIVTDDKKYVEGLGIKFKQIVSNSPLEDFMFMANAERLAISPSTFSWWAGFLGYHKQVLVPIGIGPWDMGVLDNDQHSAHKNLDLCWGEECEPVNVCEKTAYTLICTGNYKKLFPGFYESFKKHVDGKLYVLTESPEEFKKYDVETLKINHLPWPGIVLEKYKYFLIHKNIFKRHENIIFLQANMRFVKHFNFDNMANDLLFCKHPWAGIENDYICGGLVGGKAEHFIKMTKTVDEWLSRHPDATWHDETALNWYWQNHNIDCIVLNYDFMWAEETPKDKTENSVIMLLDKNKFFGCKKSIYGK